MRPPGPAAWKAPATFRYEEQAGVATITLDRPDRLNALTFGVYRELTDAFAALAARASVRAVVVAGAGRAFCSGGDVKEIIGPLLAATPAERAAFARTTCELIRRMRDLPVPVIAAVGGACAGAGAAIALACDVRLAAPEARFAFLFVRVGLSGADMGVAFLLPRVVGAGRAAELLLTGDFIDAAEAHRIGLVNRVVPAADLAVEARSLAARLAAGPAFALTQTRRALDREAGMDLGQALDAEAAVQAVCMEHPDFAEGYRAFLERREPEFR
jgi:enoyl-CoA hydratase/carnithine racemase